MPKERETPRGRREATGKRGWWLRGSVAKKENAAKVRAVKVSLILISISWCDVHLTTRHRDCHERASIPPPFPPPSLFLSSLFLFVLSRAEIPREMFYSETPRASAKVETNCCPSTRGMPLARTRLRRWRQRRSSSSYRNLHTIRVDSAGPPKTGTREGHLLAPISTSPGRASSSATFHELYNVVRLAMDGFRESDASPCHPRARV